MSSKTKWKLAKIGKENSKKFKKLYNKKCQEFEESLAYLDIEGEQNKILENKTIELQYKVENEIKMIKDDWEEIISERENLHKEEIEYFQEIIKGKDQEIQDLNTNFMNIEGKTQSLIKKFNSELAEKDNELEIITREMSKKGDKEIEKKIEKISDLERKIQKIKNDHNDEIIQLKKTIKKYQNLLNEKDIETEHKIQDLSAAFRKKETFLKSENFKIKKDWEVRIIFINTNNYALYW